MPDSQPPRRCPFTASLAAKRPGGRVRPDQVIRLSKRRTERFAPLNYYLSVFEAEYLLHELTNAIRDAKAAGHK